MKKIGFGSIFVLLILTAQTIFGQDVPESGPNINVNEFCLEKAEKNGVNAFFSLSVANGKLPAAILYTLKCSLKRQDESIIREKVVCKVALTDDGKLEEKTKIIFDAYPEDDFKIKCNLFVIDLTDKIFLEEVESDDLLISIKPQIEIDHETSFRTGGLLLK